MVHLLHQAHQSQDAVTPAKKCVRLMLLFPGHLDAETMSSSASGNTTVNVLMNNDMRVAGSKEAYA